MRARLLIPYLPLHPDDPAIAEAAALLRAGALVAFPTETVYGLGVRADRDDAVQRLYDAKGRPSSNPLIVHVADIGAARACATEWTPTAQRLAERFWPGPLTLVLRSAPGICAKVRAGGDTVGLRIPAHPVALELLRAAGVPVAAPSANRSTHISPTTASHVSQGIGDRIDAIVDGGPCTVGIESTVVDATQVDRVRILRPGILGAGELAEAAGVPVEMPAAEPRERAPLRAPGMLKRHYAPSILTVLVTENDPGLPGDFRIAFDDSPQASAAARTLPRHPHAAAAQLYALLREGETSGAPRIAIEQPPPGPEWDAIRDRIHRAATPPDGEST